MKIFKILLILALGLQIGLLGAEGESGSATSNDNDEDYRYYLKYQSKAIVNNGEVIFISTYKFSFLS